MERRKFIVGLGGAALGGSALLGSGAFSRIEAQRGVSIQVAEDPDAYLGLDKCDTPNGSYVDFDKGHLQVLMNPDNPTIGDTPLGEGINSDSKAWFHNVFQICNQGKDHVCVYIEEFETLDLDPDYEDEPTVDFYLGDDPDSSIVGEENQFLLELGECVCIGIRTTSKGLKEGDLLIPDEEIRIIADVDGDCRPGFPDCPFYGTSREDPTAIFSIQYDGDADAIIETQIGDIPDDDPDSNYPNGLAFDDDNSVWYFAEKNGELKTMNEEGALDIEEYGVISPGGEPIAGAAFWNQEGEYLFIPNGTNKLMAADISGGSADTREVTDLDWSNIGLGDLAIDRNNNILYVSTTATAESGPNFFSVDLDDTDEQNEIVAAGADSTEFATGKQIAFAEGTLWAHEAEGGDWWTVDVSDGSMGDVVDTTSEYTDLAQCGEAEYEEPPA